MKKISQITRSPNIAKMSTKAKHYIKLTQVIKDSLPDWFEYEGLNFEIKKSIIYLQTTQHKRKLLRQILPILRQNLRPYGIKNIRIMVVL